MSKILVKLVKAVLKKYRKSVKKIVWVVDRFMSRLPNGLKIDAKVLKALSEQKGCWLAKLIEILNWYVFLSIKTAEKPFRSYQMITILEMGEFSQSILSIW